MKPQALHKQHFNLVDLVDARRRGDVPAQVFPTEEALLECTKRTASYFPRDISKAGKLLRKLLRKPRNAMAGNPISFLSIPSKRQDKQAKSKSSQIKKTPPGTEKREARSKKKYRVINGAFEAAESSITVEFESD